LDTGTPIFVTCRDRVRDLRHLIDWLERAEGVGPITLLDNQSTYPPLVDYLSRTPHGVIELERNFGSRALWDAGLVPDDSSFVVTDPDILPIKACPLDALAHLHRLLDEHPTRSKVGLGLYFEDVDFPSKAWERTLVSVNRETSPGVFDSLIDTTFALYRPGASFEYEAIRTGWPYLARHMSWYVTEPDAEDAYYLERAEIGPTGSSWKEALGAERQAAKGASDIEQD
jgi:hypothetical protein